MGFSRRVLPIRGKPRRLPSHKSEEWPRGEPECWIFGTDAERFTAGKEEPPPVADGGTPEAAALADRTVRGRIPRLPECASAARNLSDGLDADARASLAYVIAEVCAADYPQLR
jgi:hypothetical protein